MSKLILALVAACSLATTAEAAEITSLPGGQSTAIPAANEMTAGPRVFGPVPEVITYTASQNMALYGWTGSYITDSLAWNAGGPPIIGNNVFTPSTVTLRFLIPISAFLAEMNWERRFGSVVTFAALDILGADIEMVTLNDGTGVPASQLRMTGGTYGIAHATSDIYGIRLTNGALAIRNLVFSTTAATGAVPEPTTWAMMLVGIGVIGGTMRYRRRTTKLAFAG